MGASKSRIKNILYNKKSICPYTVNTARSYFNNKVFQLRDSMGNNQQIRSVDQLKITLCTAQNIFEYLAARRGHGKRPTKLSEGPTICHSHSRWSTLGSNMLKFLCSLSGLLFDVVGCKHEGPFKMHHQSMCCCP